MQSENFDSNDKRSELLTLQGVQRRLELCLASAGIGLWTYNVATDEFWADDRTKQLHGHAPSEVQTFAEAGINIHPEDRQRTQAAIAQAIQDGSKLQLEYRVIWPDGSVRGIASSAEFVPSGEQNGGIFYGVAQDITDRLQDEGDRKRAEEKLRLSEEKYRALFSQVISGIAENDLQGKFITVNDYFCQTVGYSRQELLQMRMQDITHKDDLPGDVEQFERLTQKGEPFEIEKRYIRKDGTEVWVHNSVSAITDGSGLPVSVVAVSLDITDRVRVEDERKRQEANLAFLAQTSADFAPLLSIEEVMERVGKRLADFLNLSRCNLSVVDEEADRIECIYAWRRDDSMPNLFGAHRISTFLNEEGRRHYAAGKLSVINDTRTNQMLNPTFEMWDELGFGSIVDVPYLKDGRWKFLLTVARSEAGEWREDEVDLIRELVERIYIRIERARAEAALRVSEEKYRALFNSIDEGYCVIEMHIEPGKPLDYRFIETNQAFEQQSTLLNAQGKWMRELRPNHEESWFEIYRNVALTGEPIRFEHGGSELGNRWFTLYAFRIGHPNERRVAILFNDITERKQAEQAKAVFLSNITHEFRTPLTLLLSSIEETLSDLVHTLSPAQQWQQQLAHQNAMRLLKLVNTLLDVSRIEAGHIQAVYEPTDLATLTTELASSFESAIEQAGLQLAIDCPPLPDPVYVDRSMWEKIVLNLLSNAFKFTFAGEIAVRLRLAGERVELTIQDTGIGIATAEVPHLFDRFYQVKGAKGRSFEGSGIGLSLVQELVKLHGGTIQVSSIEGEGSCFTVSIPTGLAHIPPEQIGSSCKDGFSQDAFGQSEDGSQNPPLPSTATEASTYVEEALGWLPEKAQGESQEPRLESRANLLPSASCLLPSTLRILLVDDNTQMRAYLKRLLEERWQVETAANGALALTQIQQNPPDLVLTDIMMPEMDGLQLLQAVRANPQTKTIPIILLSARAGEEATIEGLETGADDYLIKPFSARELMARVETHLQLALLRQERSANRFKSEFLLTLTHELQSPLSLILGWVRLLQTKSFDAETTAQALAAIERSATIEAKLIKDLLDVSGLLSGKVQLKSHLIELIPALRGVVTQFRVAAQAKQIQLIETILNVPQRNIVADGDRLKQILANLLDNAIKFTPEGGQVTIRLECVDSEVHITVTDTGIGIPPDFLPYIFDRFTQAEVPSRHSPGGVGIGLAIARLLVELHQGTIEVASEGEGRGATFTVRLPLVSTKLKPNPTTPG